MPARLSRAAGALALAMLGLTWVAGPASAHSPSFDAQCSGATVTAVAYTAADTNTIGIQLDGGAWKTETFDTGDSLSVAIPQDGVVHTVNAYVHTTNPNPAYSADYTSAVGPCGAPLQHVTVNPSFTDNVCSNGQLTAPTMSVPDVAGTTHTVTGSPSPGATVTVVYTAVAGFVIDGQSTFTHTFPATPDDAQDCATQPPAKVRHLKDSRRDCSGVDRRSWDLVTTYVWNGTKYVAGKPTVKNDTGWVHVRDLTHREKVAQGCIKKPTGPDVAGEQAHHSGGSHVAGVQAAAQPTAQQAAPAQQLPTVVEAGLPSTGPAALAQASSSRSGLVPVLAGLVLIIAGALRRSALV